MRQFFKLAVVTTLLATTGGLAHAADTECTAGFLASMARQLGIKDLAPRADGGALVATSCSVWSHDPNVRLAAFAYDTGVEYQKTLVVAKTDVKSARVLSHYTAAIGEDAIFELDEASIRLDTARYQLSKDMRAFGVRFHSSARGASCGEANWNDELTLYVQESTKLHPVMRLYMDQQRSLAGCLNAGMSGSVWENATLSISTAKTSTNGFADLLVTADIQTDSSDEGSKLPKPRKEHHLLRYDGTQYARGAKAPWWMGWQ